MIAPDDKQITTELGRILDSRRFRNAKLLQKLLRFVVESRVQNPKADLSISILAKQVFGRDETFDNRFDAVVRVNALRLRNALDLYNADEGASSDVVIAISPGSYVPEFKFRNTSCALSPAQRALDEMSRYQCRATTVTHMSARRAMDKALREFPEDANLLAHRAELSVDTYSLGFGGCERDLDHARSLSEQAMSIDNSTAQVYFVVGLLALMDGKVNEVRQAGERLQLVDSETTDAAKLGDWLTMIATPPTHSSLATSMAATGTVDEPGWINHPMFLNSYVLGDYEAALDHAIASGMPEYFWGPMIRAAVLGQLGLTKVASRELSRALCLNPSLSTDAEFYLSRYILNEPAVEHLYEGLEKAGLRELVK